VLDDEMPPAGQILEVAGTARVRIKPTYSGSKTTASGSRRCSSSARVVLPLPKAPFSQMIKASLPTGKHTG
jgi:hypothetical protein